MYIFNDLIKLVLLKYFIMSVVFICGTGGFKELMVQIVMLRVRNVGVDEVLLSRKIRWEARVSLLLLILAFLSRILVRCSQIFEYIRLYYNKQLISDDQEMMLDNPKIIGKLSLPIVLCVSIPIMLATPLYTYHMAVSTGQQKPFPHATVTSTAEHYPQNIVFRFIMLFCSSLLALTFYCAFRWIQYEAIRVGYPLLGKWLFYLAEGSILCYGLTIGTIDGKGGIKLHDICAVIFFVVWMVTILTMTVYIRKLRSWDTSVLSRSSMAMKLVLAIYITAIWVWCIYGLITTSSNKKSDKYVVILEWNSVMINLLWVFTMVFEWKKFSLALTKNK